MRMRPLGCSGSGQRRNTQSSWPSQVTGPGMLSAFSEEPQGEQVTVVVKQWGHMLVKTTTTKKTTDDLVAEKRLHYAPAYLEYYCDINAIYATVKTSNYTCKRMISPLTCRLGSGEDKLCSAAALDLPIAGMNVNPVNCEWLQAGDLQLTLRHRLLHELELSDHWLQVSCAAVATSCLDRRYSAAVCVQAVAPGVSGVGDTKQISTATIWWPVRERKRKLGLRLFF